MKIPKFLGVILLTIPAAFSLSACEVDNVDQTDIPAIYDQVENLYNEMKNSTSCKDIEIALEKYEDKYANDPYEKSRLGKACLEYESTKKEVNGLDMAVDLTNSGFYMASYLLLVRWRKAIDDCSPDAEHKSVDVMEKYNELFSHSCQNLLNDAEKYVKKHAAPIN